MKGYIVKGNKTSVFYGLISEKKAIAKLLDAIKYNYKLQWFIEETEITSIEDLLKIDKFADLEN